MAENRGNWSGASPSALPPRDEARLPQSRADGGAGRTEPVESPDFDDAAAVELAERLDQNDEDALWAHLVASLVAQGDAPGAFWITRSLEDAEDLSQCRRGSWPPIRDRSG